MFTRKSPYDARLKMTGREWYAHLLDELMNSESKWMGKRALKNPLDAWIYQELLYEVQPRTIVELGSAYGGSTLFLAHMLDLIGAGKVVAVDHSHEKFDVKHPRITTVTGRTDEVVGDVAALCEGKTLVIHDASHEEGMVLKDLRLYAPLVSQGSYLIVEDGVRDLITDKSGPLAAVERFLRETDDFKVDESRERFLLTYNPKGFLLKS